MIISGLVILTLPFFWWPVANHRAPVNSLYKMNIYLPELTSCWYIAVQFYSKVGLFCIYWMQSQNNSSGYSYLNILIIEA